MPLIHPAAVLVSPHSAWKPGKRAGKYMLAAIEAISAKQTHRIREFIFIRFWVQRSGVEGSELYG